MITPTRRTIQHHTANLHLPHDEKPFKLQMEPHKPISGSLKTSDKIEYITSLLRLMILEDIGRSSAPTIAVEDTGIVRRLPVLNVKFLNPLSRRLKSEQETDIARKLYPTDDPFLTKLQAEWVGKFCTMAGSTASLQSSMFLTLAIPTTPAGKLPPSPRLQIQRRVHCAQASCRNWQRWVQHHIEILPCRLRRSRIQQRGQCRPR
jgi:hypothetical protein